MVNGKNVEFATIASSSKGNCTFIGTENTKILIDAGVSGKKVESGLAELGLTGNDIDAIFVTHEHNDHVDGIGVLSRRFDIPVYATEGTWESMPEKVGKIRECNKKAVYAGEYCLFNDLNLCPFTIPHDAAQPVGYRINVFDKTITVATDLGHITESIIDNTKDCDLVLIESNHNVDMVYDGSYPMSLKKRVLSDYGHLSNENCANVLKEVLSSRLKNVILGHLSNENNDPRLAFNTVGRILMNEGVTLGEDMNLYVAAPQGVKRRIVL